MSKQTINYSLIKPDDDDFYNINDFNKNMDVIDELLKSGDTSDNVASFQPCAERINISSGDSHKILFGKVAKWFSDLKALAFKDKVGSEDIVSLSASKVSQDVTHRFTTDAEKTAWNNKADKTTATETTDGLMAAGDKLKLDGIPQITSGTVLPAEAKEGDIFLLYES